MGLVGFLNLKIGDFHQNWKILSHFLFWDWIFPIFPFTLELQLDLYWIFLLCAILPNLSSVFSISSSLSAAFSIISLAPSFNSPIFFTFFVLQLNYIEFFNFRDYIFSALEILFDAFQNLSAWFLIIQSFFLIFVNSFFYFFIHSLHSVPNYCNIFRLCSSDSIGCFFCCLFMLAYFFCV